MTEALQAAHLPDLQFDRAKKRLLECDEWLLARDQATGIIDAGGMYALLGIPGTGKTQMAVDLALHVMRCLKTALYTPCADLFAALRECYGTNGTGRERAVIAKYVQPHFLILDDTHIRGHTDAENRALFSVLDSRYNRMRPTFMAANVDPNTFKEQMGAAIFDRLIEFGGMKVCTWPSFREAAAIARKAGNHVS